MTNTSSFLSGSLDPWPAKETLRKLLQSNGLDIYLGKYSVRLMNLDSGSSFSFEHYGGDICDPTISAYSNSPENMLSVAQLVSNTLIKAKIKHRFEIYDYEDKMTSYLHHEWPLAKSL